MALEKIIIRKLGTGGILLRLCPEYSISSATQQN